MKRILVVYDCNNGYQCSCCRRDWEETETYEVEDDVVGKEFVDNLRKNLVHEYNYGRQDIVSAYVISEVIIE